MSEMLTFYTRKAEYYRKHPEELDAEQEIYSVIVSRHPVDVLRMSDFADMSSCHSVGGAYYQCAISEARNQGMIAYVAES